MTRHRRVSESALAAPVSARDSERLHHCGRTAVLRYMRRQAVWASAERVLRWRCTMDMRKPASSETSAGTCMRMPLHRARSRGDARAGREQAEIAKETRIPQQALLRQAGRDQRRDLQGDLERRPLENGVMDPPLRALEHAAVGQQRQRRKARAVPRADETGQRLGSAPGSRTAHSHVVWSTASAEKRIGTASSARRRVPRTALGSARSTPTAGIARARRRVQLDCHPDVGGGGQPQRKGQAGTHRAFCPR